MIRALIFDCFGVIYSEAKSSLTELCPPDKRLELMDLYAQSDHGFISGEEFSRAVAELIGMPPAELESIISAQYVRNDQLLDFVRAQKATFKTALLSNVGDDLIGKLFTADEQREFFDTIVLSSSVGFTKPSPEIYEIAASRLGVLPEECIFTDDIPANIDGANIVGMHGVLFTSNQQVKDDILAIAERENA